MALAVVVESELATAVDPELFVEVAGAVALLIPAAVAAAKRLFKSLAVKERVWVPVTGSALSTGLTNEACESFMLVALIRIRIAVKETNLIALFMFN